MKKDSGEISSDPEKGTVALRCLDDDEQDSTGPGTYEAIRGGRLGDEKRDVPIQDVLAAAAEPPSGAGALSRLSTSSSRWSQEPPPDGGLKAWTMCACAHVVIANTWGFVNSFGIFQAYYADFLELPPSTISWIGSIQIFLAFFLSTFTGRLSDAGYFRQVFCVGAAFQVLGVFATSACTRYWQLMLAQGVCIGIAAGCLCCPIMSVMSTYFDRRKALALGIVTCGNVSGGLVFPAMARQLLPTVGFALTIRAIGSIQVVLLLGCCIVARARVKPTPGPLLELKAFKELEYTFYTLGMFFNLAGTFIAYYYAASFGRTGVTPPMSYPDSLNLLLILNGIGIFGRLGAAFTADRAGPLNLVYPSAFAGALCCLAWIAVRTPAATYAWASVYGVAGGMLQALFPAGLMRLTSDLRKVGLRMGMAFTVVSFAVLAGPPVAGVLVTEVGGRYIGAQAFAGSLLLVGGSFVCAAKVARMAKTGGSWWDRI